ncbi:MAG: patatin-like protein [Ilumatobacteraceae bacterium]
MDEGDPDVREVRLAVVMTGGVSLAVWIGGVVAEIYRAQRGDGIYGALRQATRSKVTIDVISGASAGGVNGAFLASAVAYQPETSKFDTLRSVWLQDGAFESLLRKPSDRHPPSLLQGDAYFLARLEAVLLDWTRADRKSTLDTDELTLVMTTTTLTPERREYLDDLRVPLVEAVHRARFTFRHTDFDGGDRTVLARRLALAARSTASFPGAFEPAFVPIGGSAPSPAGKGAPRLEDMTGVASFGASRWVIDGGVLVNMPVTPAIEAIKRRTADREVRRVLLYVNPDPAEIDSDRVDGPDDINDMPTVAKVVAKSLVSLPRTESISADLDEIRRLNRQVVRQRDTRVALLLGVRVRDSGAGDDADVLGPWRIERPDLVELARQLYPLWLRERSFESVQARLTSIEGYEPSAPIADGDETWADFAQALRFARGTAGWLASELPQLHDDPEPDRPHDPTEALHLDVLEQWRVGLEPLEYIGSVVLDLVRRAYAAAPLTARPGEVDAEITLLRERLGDLRGVVHAQRSLIGLLRFVDDEFWQTELGRPWPGDTLAARAESLLALWPLPTVPLGTTSSTPPAPAKVRADRWAQASALWNKAAEMEFTGDAMDVEAWDRLTDAVLDTRSRSADVNDAAGLDEETRTGTEQRARVRRAYRRAEAVIARRLVRALVDSTPILYQACDHALVKGWRTKVVEAATEDGRPDAFERPAVPGLALGEPVLRPPSDATVLAAITLRLTWRSPSPADPPEPPVVTPRLAVQVLQQLVGLYVVQTFADRGLDETEVRIEFLQLSADNETPLTPGRDATSKIAGLQLGHFGGFLKRSWRANDWMWGTLDSTYRLVGLLVDPARLRQRFSDKEQATAALCAIAAGRSTETGEPLDPSLAPDDVAFLKEMVTDELRGKVRDELAFLDGDGGAPADLPVTRWMIGRTAQLIAARRELVEVARAIEVTRRDRASESIPATEFYVAMAPYLPSGQPGAGAPEQLPLSKVTELLQQAPIAAERVRHEFGSDRFTATAAQAAAVTGNLVGGRGLGVGVVRRPLTAARYGLRGLSALADSALKETRTQSAFRNILLAIAGVVLAAALVGVAMPGALLITGLLALAGWLGLTALGLSWRGMLWLPLILVTLLVVLTFLEGDDAQRAFTELHGEQGWKVPTLVIGLIMAVSGVVVEAVRYAVSLRSGWTVGDQPGWRRHAHLVHAAVWVGIGGAWFGLWWLLFNGDYAGTRRWFVDAAAELHGVRYVLFIAIPAAFIGVDLTRTWIAETHVRRQRQRAQHAAGVDGGGAQPS